MHLTRRPLVSITGWAAVAVIMAIVACSSEDNGTNPPPGNTTPAAIAVTSGNNQSGTVNAALASPLVVTVTNSDGDPLSGVGVSWTVAAGGGSLSAATSTTNAQGQASINYTLGPNAGTNTINAAVTSDNSLSTSFTATANAPPVDMTPASIEISGGNNQSTTVNQPLANPLTVVVKNAGGTALANVDVSWAVTGGGGTLGMSNSMTNASGIASNTYTAGASAGANEISAAVTSNSTLNVQFTATSTAIMNGAVSVEDNLFDPDAVDVSVGGTVTWTWNGAVGHNVTWVSGGFSNSSTQTSGTHDVTFNSAGTYQYYCTIHGTPTTGMRGTVTAQ
jgi:adhesin/invasin